MQLETSRIVRIQTSVCVIASLLLSSLVLLPSAIQAKESKASTKTSPSASNTSGSAAASEILTVNATAGNGGNLVQWSIEPDGENPGFYIYRIQNSRMSLGSRISGAATADGTLTYRWFDPNGTQDSTYYIESINLKRSARLYHAVVSVSRGRGQSDIESTAPAREDMKVQEYPASQEASGSSASESNLTNQWVVAGQSALKIQIKSDGWYRVTQQQMAGAGFNPAVGIQNLSLFNDGVEIAILTNKDTGLLRSGDYLEFYGRGLDTDEADSRIYYLIAGSTAGKRIQGNLQTEVVPTPVPGSSPPQSTSGGLDFTYRGRFPQLLDLIRPEDGASSRNEEGKPAVNPLVNIVQPNTTVSPASLRVIDLPIAKAPAKAVASPKDEVEPATPEASIAESPKSDSKAAAPVNAESTVKKKRRKAHHRSRRSRKRSKVHHNHALAFMAGPILSFNDTLQVKERFNYNPQLPNGFNFFGSTIGTTFPLNKTIAIHNVQTAADGPARLEIALQGISLQSHQANVLLNGTSIGTINNFFGHDHVVQSFSIPLAQLLEGNNTVRIEPVGQGQFLGLDYLSLTYPHSYRAFDNSLRFTSRATQTLQVDGFSSSAIRLLDISDPTTVKVTRPFVAAVSGGFAITVPGSQPTKAARTMIALPEGQFSTPAGFTLNQPSSLNSNAGAQLLIVANKDFIPSLAPLVTKRQQQGFSVLVADVEDVYDEFSFGVHSSHALQDLFSWARSNWAVPPQYVLLAGDGSYDPRGHFAIAMARSGGGCNDTNSNADDFFLMQFGNAHNSNFHNSTPCGNQSGLVISQIYTGSGDKQASFANTYIELFNRSSAPINVNGWSVQYASATGSTWQVTPLSNVTIQPGNYYLAQQASSGGIFPLPTPDVVGNISMSVTAGKVALVNNTTPLVGSCATGASVIDSVGYGSTANCFEGSGPVAISADFVPTRQVDTVYGVACSDDALADFNDDGIAEIPVGRLPARTPAEATLVVSKIVNFSTANVPQTALFVADAQGTYYWNFELHSDELANLLPQSLATQKIYLASQPSPPACQANIINSINQGVALVNYQGHGNVNVWSGSTIFTASDAQTLTNNNKLPLVIVADCLNGLFNDPTLEGLGETLLKAPHGGGVAIYASSGETIPDGQQEMSIRVYQLLFGPQSMALGDVTKQAKSATNDMDVRRTWILLGDPSMKIW